MNEIRMAKLSPTMEVGTIAKWHKKEGDKIESGDLLLEIATDKATIEHNALDEGFMRKILVKEGQEAKVGEPIAIWTEAKDTPLQESKKSTPSTAPPKEAVLAPASSAPLKETKPPLSTGRLRASPLAKKLAKKNGIDLSTLRGTGPGGRILRRDLTATASSSSRETREEPLSQIRKVIAEKLQKAKQEIPHFYLTQEIVADQLALLQQELVESGHSITFNDLLVKAAALALQKHPEVNCGFQESRKTLLRFGSIDVCVAVSTDRGLITPFVKNCDQKKLFDISRELKDLIQRARQNKLQLHEFQGGSFTVSNLGMLGISHFAAVINPPQGAILACGAIEEKPLVLSGTIQIAKALTVTLSVDHRVIDGADAARFLQTYKAICEKPLILIL